MAMDGAALAAALKPVIESEIRSQYTIISGFGDAEIQKFAQAMADAIGPVVVSYITANAQVLVTGVQGGGGSAAGTIS